MTRFDYWKNEFLKAENGKDLYNICQDMDRDFTINLCDVTDYQKCKKRVCKECLNTWFEQEVKEDYDGKYLH